MELFIADAFTTKLFEGNQAGVVLLNELEAFPEDSLMQKISAELKHSETVFVKALPFNTFQLRYFTPEGEVALCGHATISAYTVLRDEKDLACGGYFAETQAGRLNVTVEEELIWLETARGELLRYLTDEESAALYDAYHLNASDQPPEMRPCIVSTGLADILLPVNDKEALDNAVQKRDEIIRMSEKLRVTGVHMFYFSQSPKATAYCRNFAPLYGIDEESATGTSNASLTYYLGLNGRIQVEQSNVFLQGETMGKPSVILSRICNDGRIWIGGRAVISIKGGFSF